MSTTVLARIRTLVCADAHEVLESLEEPALLLKQCVREAELELARKRAAKEALSRQTGALEQNLCGLETRMADLDRDIDLALGRGEEHLARFSIRRLLPLRELDKTLRDEHARTQRRYDALCEVLTSQEAQLEDLRARVRSAIRSDVGALGVTTPGAPGAVADEEVELELLRRAAAAEGA